MGIVRSGWWEAARLEVDAATLRERIEERAIVALPGVALGAFERADAEGHALVPRVDGRGVAATRGVCALDAVIEGVFFLAHGVHPRVQVCGGRDRRRLPDRLRDLGKVGVAPTAGEVGLVAVERGLREDVGLRVIAVVFEEHLGVRVAPHAGVRRVELDVREFSSERCRQP